MKANQKHYTLLILGIISTILTLSGYYYVYKITIDQAQKQAFIIKSLELDNGNKKQEDKLLKIDISTKDKREILWSYLISDDDILDFIKSIENIANYSSTELTLSSISTADLNEKKKDQIGYIKLHIEVKGNWINVNKALAMIENLPYEISFDSLSLNLSDKKKWDLSLNIKALALK